MTSTSISSEAVRNQKQSLGETKIMDYNAFKNEQQIWSRKNLFDNFDETDKNRTTFTMIYMRKLYYSVRT